MLPAGPWARTDSLPSAPIFRSLVLRWSASGKPQVEAWVAGFKSDHPTELHDRARTIGRICALPAPSATSNATTPRMAALIGLVCLRKGSDFGTHRRAAKRIDPVMLPGEARQWL
jgi:hypothetical protein